MLLRLPISEVAKWAIDRVTRLTFLTVNTFNVINEYNYIPIITESFGNRSSELSAIVLQWLLLGYFHDHEELSVISPNSSQVYELETARKGRGPSCLNPCGARLFG